MDVAVNRSLRHVIASIAKKKLNEKTGIDVRIDMIYFIGIVTHFDFYTRF